MRAYNRHLEDDWGYRYQNRIFAVLQLTLDDLDLAVEELERLIRANAKFVLLPPRSTATHRSPADPYRERLVEANVLPPLSRSPPILPATSPVLSAMCARRKSPRERL